MEAIDDHVRVVKDKDKIQTDYDKRYISSYCDKYMSDPDVWSQKMKALVEKYSFKDKELAFSVSKMISLL